MDAKELSALRQAAQKATPGPWIHRRSWDYDEIGPVRKTKITIERYVDIDGTVIETETGREVEVEPVIGAEERGEPTLSDEDATFIAAANPATVLRLLDYVASLKREIHDYKKNVDKIV